MEHNQHFAQLQEEMRNNFSDIKAESILAIALDGGLGDDEYCIAADSLFSRSYSRDILFSTIEEDANKKDFLQLHLSRSGLHDHLPEGLFYQPEKLKYRDTDATIMAEDHIKNKQKEQEIRRFFMPFENAFFGQRMQLESEEIQLLEGLQNGILNEYFMNFWGISSALPHSLVTPLIELLPYANKIAGNLSITTQCLGKILQEKVTTRPLPAPVTEVGTEYIYGLGIQQLGLNMVLGDKFDEDFPLIEFSIGPLQNSKIEDYLSGGCKEEFLNTFYSFFMPVEASAITKIEIEKEKEYMILDLEVEPILGYSSVLYESLQTSR